MRPAAVGEILIQKANCPLSDEAELHAVLTDARAAAAARNVLLFGDAWRTVRLLASAARCTLQAGRGDFALPLITTAFDLCPEPFRRLASLQNEKEAVEGCALVRSMLTAAKSEGVGQDVPAVVCTALMVWHGALASTASTSSCPRGFFRFSHVAGEILTELAMDASTLDKLAECWLYNTLAFADRSKNTKAAAFYLLEELQDEIQTPELRERGEWGLVCSAGRNACVRVGLHGPQVVAKWDRLCMNLYAEGCAFLHASQEEVQRRASGAMSILRKSFATEKTCYLIDFRRPLQMSSQEATLLRDAAASTDLCVPREDFTPIRVACFLKHYTGREGCNSSVSFPFASVSSVVSIAQRHRYADIAIELIRTGSAPSLGDDSLLLWGTELECLINRAVGSDGAGVECAPRERASTHVHFGVPCPLLHEIAQEWRATDVLRILASSQTVEDKLPAGLTMIRGDRTIGHQILRDKIAPSFVLDGLSRLIVFLVDEGDLPLARCFIPLVAGICERMSSQANILVTLHAIAAFAQGCHYDDTDGYWTAVTRVLLPVLLPRSSGMSPPYRQTKSVVAGRTFSSRRRVFDAFCGTFHTRENVHSHCQLQVLLTSDHEGVQLSRSSSVEGMTVWEKVLPVGRTLLEMVARMREIEAQNRRHLEAALYNKEVSLLGKEKMEAPSDATEAFSNSEVERQSRKARAEWWEQRHAFDSAMRKVVEKLQSDECFGCWRVAMCGDLSPSCLLELKQVAAQLLHDIGAPAHHVLDLTLILAGLPFLGTRCCAGGKLLFSPSHGSAEGKCASCDEVLCNLSEALEIELLKNGIAAPSTGLLSALRGACLSALAKMCKAISVACESELGHLDLFSLSRSSLYLVLDNELHALPLEGMDVLLAGNVARVPTSTFISTSKAESLDICDGGVYCVIDPAGDMPKTSKRLLPVCRRTGWKASTQSVPCGELMHELYSYRAKAYVYVGHGKGERFLHRGELYERLPDPDEFPAVFLMGCSSAYMEGGASYDSYGMPYAFLHAGCPLFLGCLWHVTDGEIDRLTKRLLLLLAGEAVNDGDGASLLPPRTVGEALALARRACKLPFLTGCAAVLYGTNLSLERTVDG
ncbi:putative Peptidase C50 separase [Trypanosoma cruzi]|uniref:separase n=2 Tax=Trypanosoma cruzi TaxID=5693 RepID=A0A2V2V2K9_TRYCR|nr:putative Peptidase C50 separase [Trypanosoma cruzi]